MSPTPRRTIENDFLMEFVCPICGQDSLNLRRMDRYPDFVTCSTCESQFVAEDGGERVMYGKIPATYPRTRRFALQQWVWPEAIARRATPERPAPSPSADPDPETPPTAVPEETEPPRKPDAVAVPLEEPDEQDLLTLAEAEEGPPEEDAIEDDVRAVPIPDEEPDALADLWDEPTQEGVTTAELVDEEETELPTEAFEAPEADSWEHEFEAEDAAAIDDLERATAADILGETASGEVSTDEFEAAMEETLAEVTEDESEAEDLPEREYLDELGWDDAADAETAAEVDTLEADADLGPPPVTSFEEETKPPESVEIPSEMEATEEAERFLEGIEEGDSQVDWDAAGAATFMPPFGDSGEDGESPVLPGEEEPAPPIPDWLQQPAESDEDTDLEPDQGLDPPDEGSPDAQEETEEDLLDSLWGEDDRQPAETTFPEAEEPIEVERDLDWGFSETEAEVERSDLQSAIDDDPFSGLEETKTAEDMAPGVAGEGALAVEEPELTTEQVAEQYWAGEVAAETPAALPSEGPTEEAQAEDALGEGGEEDGREPPPGDRYRVVLKGNQPQFPKDVCAHCTRSPAPGRLSITATLFRGAGLGERSLQTFRVPLCNECQARYTAESEEKQTARLQAHLVSVLVAMVLVVGSLAFRLVDFQGNLLLDLIVLLILAGMGYIIPAVFLLVRASRYPRPEDAKFVESTLTIPADTEGAEVAFEWRNSSYAHQFRQVNEEIAASDVMKVRERAYETR